ncbi:UPF0481 protein At3g47200 [Pyrus x bretschneideri]|uniref:UPF0481 protein At3g47200 n=1 Tax=Pyrus x bretschneideri TaxID=225117 RepID=UPI000511225A|nr:UPF0481 protein At3g47200 [Pyrus x bretschneideri]XP_048437894.1 UPF0481 protein At3g47200 [Pyrus x bretschneideri]
MDEPRNLGKTKASASAADIELASSTSAGDIVIASSTSAAEFVVGASEAEFVLRASAESHITIPGVKIPFHKESKTLSHLRCIYRVPKRLRRGNEEAYTPQVVSIGPLHHGNEHLKAMEEHKTRYLRHFLSRPGVSYRHCINMITNQVENLRGFYAESIVSEKKKIFQKTKKESDKFVEVVLADAAFVIELLLRYYCITKELEDDYGQGEDDYILKNPGMFWDVRPDLRLLENQLPFFILRDLFDTAFSSSPQLPSLLKISYHFFKKEIDGKGKKENFSKLLSSGEEVKHFVDLIRILYRPLEPKKKSTDKYNITATPNVTKLHQVGVKFEVRNGSSLFDIKFSRGILEIPKLTVNDTTELTLRNFLAFEQCHHGEEDFLANYVFLMGLLAKTPKDVQLLVEKEIIENWQGDTEKISTWLHDLGTGMMLHNHYYAPLCKELKDYRKNPWHGWMVILKQKYFNTLWAGISFVAAGILLALTLIQTACSYKSAPLL